METYTNSASSSSSSYLSSPDSSTHRKPPPAYRTALHSIRKIPMKGVIMKKAIAPMPRTPPKIYKVDPINFRDVVQNLTAAPEFPKRRSQEALQSPIMMPVTQNSTLNSESIGFILSSPSALNAWYSSTSVLSP